MEEPRRIQSSISPHKFEDLGNSNWYYNYDIQSEITEVPKEDEIITETRYNYIQVKLPCRPTYKRCVEAIIREYITQSLEFDLINSYNRALFNLLSEDEGNKAANEYIEYLNKVTEIKSKIKEDFGN